MKFDTDMAPLASIRKSLGLRTIIVTCWLVAAPLVVGCQSVPTQAQSDAREAAVARATKGKALFEEKCRTVAGEKIYRTVPDIEGIVLLKVRTLGSEREWADRMWPGAAFAIEASGDDYIKSFLGFEYAPSDGLTGKPRKVTAKERGYINVYRHPGGLPGYRYVDVTDVTDGHRYRYVLGQKARPSSQIGWIDTVLQRTRADAPPPKYGVTFEDQVVPEDRDLGLASGTVKVVDLETGEVLGELTRYAWSPGGPSAANPSPWLTAYKCPGHPVGSDAATRKFVDQVLIPTMEK